ncbi:exopolyphosphatase [Bacteroidia bacterium]|nr:exopolyphosphatase [Bacteroidia bacterium]
MFNHAKIEKFIDFIKMSNNIVIATHLNPDGDAIGSATALKMCLQQINKKNVSIIVPNDFPQNLKWISESETIYLYNKHSHKKKIDAMLNSCDMLICTDFQSFSRAGDLEKVLESCKSRKVLIDHHIDPAEDQFDIVFSTTKVSSTCELLYNLIVKIGLDKNINKNVAESIFVGIMTDTGSFSYSVNNKETFLIVAKLIEKDIDTRYIHEQIYDTFSENRLRLLGYCLSERLKVFAEKAIAYIYLNKEDLKRFKYIPGDTEGIVNYALSMKDIKFAALFTEHEEKIRISFRSKGKFDTNVFAKTYFNGGGHRNASGGSSVDSIENTIKKFDKIIADIDVNVFK